MKIGELASRAGVSTQTIRYYEDIGVLPEAVRLPNGYRNYDDTVMKRLSFIRDAQTSGLSLSEIQMVLEMKDQGESTCGHVIGMLEQHLGEVVPHDFDVPVGDRRREPSEIEVHRRLAGSTHQRYPPGAGPPRLELGQQTQPAAQASRTLSKFIREGRLRTRPTTAPIEPASQKMGLGKGSVATAQPAAFAASDCASSRMSDACGARPPLSFGSAMARTPLAPPSRGS